jgi:dehydrogenase/reductase SDR family member 12
VAAPLPVRRAVDSLLEATVVLSFSRLGYLARARLGGWAPPGADAGTGRRVLVTGANSGLGYATALGVLGAGARVLLLVRSEEKGRDTVARLQRDLGQDLTGRVEVDVADLLDLASVRAFADRQLASGSHLDTVVHNAGAMFEERELTVDGFERTYQLHVLAPFLLTSLLLPRLAESAPSRVVTVTSGGMYSQKLDTARLESPTDYRPSVAYARAKRAQVALAHEWGQRVRGDGIRHHVVHPGWALTPGVERSLPRFRQLTGPLLRDATEGADSIVWVALSEEVTGDGQLWHDRHVRHRHKVPWTRSDAAESDRLWARVSRDAGIDPALPTS